jgi:uncharacterized protein YcbK (DUF882 family)
MSQLTAHFNRAEFTCHCGCGASNINIKLVELLEKIRLAVNEPIHVLSGVRCEFHNHKVGGARHSQHVLGNAADIFVDGLSPKKLHAFIENNFEVNGMGLYPTFVHVDIRTGDKVRWSGK